MPRSRRIQRFLRRFDRLRRPRLPAAPACAALLALLALVAAALGACGRGGLRYRSSAGDRHYYHVESQLAVRRGDRSAVLTSEYDLMLLVTGVRGRWADLRAGIYNARGRLENPRQARAYPMPPDQEWPVLADVQTGRFSGPGGGNPPLGNMGDLRLEDLVGELAILPDHRSVRPGDSWTYERRTPPPVVEPAYLTVTVRYLRDEQRDGAAVAVVAEEGGGPSAMRISDDAGLQQGQGTLTVSGTYWLDLRTGLPVAASTETRLEFRPDGGRPASGLTARQEIRRS